MKISRSKSNLRRHSNRFGVSDSCVCRKKFLAAQVLNWTFLFVILFTITQSTKGDETTHAQGTDTHKTTQTSAKESVESDNGEGLTVQNEALNHNTFDKLYADGVKAYDNQLWYSCASKLENANHDYHLYKKSLLDCRTDCLTGKGISNFSNFSTNVFQWKNLTSFIFVGDCFRRCTHQLLGKRQRIPSQIEEAFEKRKPYEFLQFCYYKLDRLRMAASAAYTFYLANPENKDTHQNIIFYQKSGVGDDEFLDLEISPYKERYIRATRAYGEKNWEDVIKEMEEALAEFLVEVKNCQTECYAKGKLRENEFVMAVSDFITELMICQLECEDTESVVYSEPIPFLLQNMLHYLQFAYYNVGDLENSAKATAAFLLLNATNKVVKNNREVIKIALGYEDEDFVPREDVAVHLKERKLMFETMDFINKNYKFVDKAELQEEEEIYEEQGETADRLRKSSDWMTRYELLGMHLFAKAEELKREQRFAVDGMLDSDQCHELLALVKDVPKDADGVQIFTLKMAQQTLQERLDEGYEASLRLFIRVAEICRHYTQRYMESKGSMYLKQSTLVCHTGPKDNTKDSNCYPQEDGNCVEFDDMSDELYTDLYTTVTYISTSDEDGDFNFLNESKEVDSSFGVKCGRMVGFNTGDRHTLKVPKNQRCALVLRYTIHESEDDKDYKTTVALLHRVDELRLASSVKSSKEVLEEFKEKGVTVVKDGKALKGKKRFAADGFASDIQCETLKNMVLLLHSGYVSTSAVKSFLELSENTRLFVEKYFNLTKPLYSDFTHLVCRIAIDESKTERKDLSHPVHADNCILHANGSCVKEYPAYFHRDYSAILYLNDNFSGGEFFFAHGNKSEQSSVRPRCGRLVGFSADEPHGVKAVKTGHRCALALWFTHNQSFRELTYVAARKALEEAEAMQQSKPSPRHEDL